MVQIIKYFKYLTKFLAILMVVFIFTTILNGTTIDRPRIHQFHIWKMNRFGSNQIKYLLIWNKGDEEWECLKDKQTVFKENKCKYDNCFVTKDRNLLGNDISKFDAILFNGKFLSDNKNSTFYFDLPKKRNLKQFYVFTMRESADNYPICHIQFDNYFNLSWTYKLNSDAIWPYFSIYNMKGKEVGPKIDMDWIFGYDKYGNKAILSDKKFAATWFVSNCYTNSRRESMFNDIMFELRRMYKLPVEVVGGCGYGECPKEKDEECMENLKKYYFYFAFENSISNDYITEKVVRALLHDTVPIVYSGADYTK